MRKALFLATCAVFLATACKSWYLGKPTPEEVEAADYGPAPVDHEAAIREFYEKNLYHPAGSPISIEKPQKGYWGRREYIFRDRVLHYGWIVETSRDLTNRFGVKVSGEQYVCCFRNGMLLLVWPAHGWDIPPTAR